MDTLGILFLKHPSCYAATAREAFRKELTLFGQAASAGYSVPAVLNLDGFLPPKGENNPSVRLKQRMNVTFGILRNGKPSCKSLGRDLPEPTISNRSLFSYG